MSFPLNKQKITETCNNPPPTAPRTIVVYVKVLSSLLVVHKSIYSYYRLGGKEGGVVYEGNLGDYAFLMYCWTLSRTFVVIRLNFTATSFYCCSVIEKCIFRLK